MKMLICLLLVATPAFATSKLTPNSAQAQTKKCEISAKLSEIKAQRVKGIHGRENRSSDLVFWQVDVVDVSDTAICPTEKSLSIRIRGADFRGSPNEPQITYQVGVSEPQRGDLFRIKIKFIKGRDVFINRAYQEWTLVGVPHD